MNSGAPVGIIAPGSGKRFATRPPNGALTCVRASCCAAIAPSARVWASPASATCSATWADEVIAVGDAAGLQQAVRALLLGLRVGAVGLRHGERGARAVVREAVVGVVEDGEHVALRDARALLAQHAQQAGLDLGHDLHLRARLQGAGEDDVLGQVALLDGGGAHGEAARGRRVLGARAARAGGEGEDGGEQQQGSQVHGVSHLRAGGRGEGFVPGRGERLRSGGGGKAAPSSRRGSWPIT